MLFMRYVFTGPQTTVKCDKKHKCNEFVATAGWLASTVNDLSYAVPFVLRKQIMHKTYIVFSLFRPV